MLAGWELVWVLVEELGNFRIFCSSGNISWLEPSSFRTILFKLTYFLIFSFVSLNFLHTVIRNVSSAFFVNFSVFCRQTSLISVLIIDCLYAVFKNPYITGLRKQLSETNTFDDSDNTRHKSAERLRFENVKNNLKLVFASVILTTVL